MHPVGGIKRVQVNDCTRDICHEIRRRYHLQGNNIPVWAQVGHPSI